MSKWSVTLVSQFVYSMAVTSSWLTSTQNSKKSEIARILFKKKIKCKYKYFKSVCFWHLVQILFAHSENLSALCCNSGTMHFIWDIGQPIFLYRNGLYSYTENVIILTNTIHLCGNDKYDQFWLNLLWLWKLLIKIPILVQAKNFIHITLPS